MQLIYTFTQNHTDYSSTVNMYACHANREMHKSNKAFEEKQNELLPPNNSWPDVLEEKLTPSEDTTGKWVASTTSFERKGLRFGMESSPASAEVKGSMQTEERDRETDREGWTGRGGRQSQKTTREGVHAEQVSEVQKTQMAVRSGCTVTCPRCWKPCWSGLHGGREGRMQVKEVSLHLHCTADRKINTWFYPVKNNFSPKNLKTIWT